MFVNAEWLTNLLSEVLGLMVQLQQYVLLYTVVDSRVSCAEVQIVSDVCYNSYFGACMALLQVRAMHVCTSCELIVSSQFRQAIREQLQYLVASRLGTSAVKKFKQAIMLEGAASLRTHEEASNRYICLVASELHKRQFFPECFLLFVAAKYMLLIHFL